jgi:hypothetical protein
VRADVEDWCLVLRLFLSGSERHGIHRESKPTDGAARPLITLSCSRIADTLNDSGADKPISVLQITWKAPYKGE